MELALKRVDKLQTERQRRFVRCVLLRTAQWALDCRKDIPRVHEVRSQLLEYTEQMLVGANKFGDAVRRSEKTFGMAPVSVQCCQRSVIGIESDPMCKESGRPKLILTSPPYPGVHVLYHRWQVLGRKETPAPFWIAGSLDGQGASFYTLGDRGQQELTAYFRQANDAFQSLARICGRKTVIVQMLAFSEPTWQLGQYLEAMKRAGLLEMKFLELANNPDGRIWREVPNRKWYATQKGTIGASSEVVLFHRLAQA